MMLVHQLNYMAMNTLLMMKFKDISTLNEKEKLKRVIGGSLYGGCHYGVVYNIFDRNYEHLGFWNTIVMCMYIGQ